MSEIRVWRIYGTILRGKNRSYPSNLVFICPSAISANIGTGLGSNTGLSDERLATNHLSHGTALDEGEWSTEVSAILPLELLTGAWVDLRVWLDVTKRRS
jgi:hypothetical protein